MEMQPISKEGFLLLCIGQNSLHISHLLWNTLNLEIYCSLIIVLGHYACQVCRLFGVKTSNKRYPA